MCEFQFSFFCNILLGVILDFVLWGLLRLLFVFVFEFVLYIIIIICFDLLVKDWFMFFGSVLLLLVECYAIADALFLGSGGVFQIESSIRFSSVRSCPVRLCYVVFCCVLNF